MNFTLSAANVRPHQFSIHSGCLHSHLGLKGLKKKKHVSKTASNHHSKLHDSKLSGNGHHVGIMIQGTERNETGMLIQEDCTGK
jgi:hypothetical protein